MVAVYLSSCQIVDQQFAEAVVVIGTTEMSVVAVMVSNRNY